MRKNWRVVLLGIIVSGVVIVLIASQINLTLLWEALRTANYWPLIPAAALTVIGLGARAIRWRVLLNGAMPYPRTFHILNISYLLNMLLPLRLGEVARMWLAWRRGVPALQTAGTVVIERLLDLLIVVVFIAITLVTGRDVPDQLRATGLFTGVAAFGGFLFLVFLSGRRTLAHNILDFFTARLPFLKRLNLTVLLDHLLDGIQPLSRPASLINALLWTTISWAFSLGTGSVLMLTFYPEIDLRAVLLYISTASFAVALPAIPGNIGPYEGSIIFALQALGYVQNDAAYATATAFALVVHFMNLAVNAGLGIIGFFAEGVSVGQLSRGVQQMRTQTAEPSN